MIRRSNREEIQSLVTKMKAEGHPNFKFADSSQNLWIRFKNYENDKNLPFVILDDNREIAAVCMITKLVMTSYCNLYDIFAVKSGYATKLYWGIMQHMYSNGVRRLKMSCTPDSIGWHYRNGIVGWAIDPTGSIRVDIPIKPTQAEQLALRYMAVDGLPQLVMPPEKQADKLRLEENSFGPKKIIQVEKAIETLGDYYMRKHLI